MKLASLTATIALSAATLFAQRGTPPDPATMIQHRVDRLTEELTLTTAQQAQATTIFTSASTAETSLRTSLQTAMQSLTASIKANTTANIDQLSAQIGTIQGQLLAADSKAQAAFYAILTADQKAIVDKHAGSLRGFGGPGGPGGPGGFGGPGGAGRRRPVN